MGAIKSVFGWVGRHGVLLVLIILALAFRQFVWPHFTAEESRQIVISELQSSQEVAGDLADRMEALRARAKRSSYELAAKTGDEARDELREREDELAEVETALGNPPGWLAGMRPSVKIDRAMLEPRKKVLEAEIGLLRAAVKPGEIKKSFFKTRTWSEDQIARQRRECDNANSAVLRFNSQSRIKKFGENVWRDRADTLTFRANAECGKVRKMVSQRVRAMAQRRKLRNSLLIANSNLAKAQQSVARVVDGASVEVIERTFFDLFKTALLILLGIIAIPLVIRIAFYHILAPLAEQGASIRISVSGRTDVKIPPSELSRVSIPITLEKGEELLVRQDYLQTSSLAGGKSTRWLLDYRHVLSSIASGLTFLTRIRGAGETTTVSAVRDPFAELTQLKLPEGSACVLQPRALVAVVQPTGRTMRITSHWRLFSLNAWLTMQLRYLVFHGPGRLIVMGGRGIRVEHAERGRIFGQHQLVGFSSDLAYSVTRTETFWPYFFGREQLFKDKVEQGNGILIIEEAPLSGRKGAGVRRGIEGAFDVGLKAFGI